MSFLLDTDICSAYLKGNARVANVFSNTPAGSISRQFSLGELYTWALRANASPKRQETLQDMLMDVIVLDVTADISRRFGEVRAGLLDRGLPAPDMDLVIGATALFHDLTLVTHNGQDYQNVPSLRLADWMVP